MTYNNSAKVHKCRIFNTVKWWLPRIEPKSSFFWF